MAEKTLTVTQLNSYIHVLLEGEPNLRSITVEGELSNVNYNYRGHIYFTLKDENASIPAVMWASAARGLSFRLSDGDKVKVKGRVTTYERSGAIQINAAKIEKAGRGDLYRKFEEIKEELREMGMFSEEYKKPLPKYVKSIGVVTSPTGSAVQDICKISKARYPGIRIVVYPAKVQGDGADASIVRGIEILDGMGLDVLIVGRGGGTIEDLWCFNEVSVARAIFNANTPVISAVGHQDDYTIADFVADVRASTPSNAAELAVFEYSRLREAFSSCKKRMDFSMRGEILKYESMINSIRLKLKLYSPRGRLEQNLQRADELAARMERVHPREILSERRKSLAQAAVRLDYLSPVKKLSSGYSYITDSGGRNVKSHSQVSAGDSIDIKLSEGALKARVLEVFDTAFEQRG